MPCCKEQAEDKCACYCRDVNSSWLMIEQDRFKPSSAHIPSAADEGYPFRCGLTTRAVPSPIARARDPASRHETTAMFFQRRCENHQIQISRT